MAFSIAQRSSTEQECRLLMLPRLNLGDHIRRALSHDHTELVFVSHRAMLGSTVD